MRTKAYAWIVVLAAGLLCGHWLTRFEGGFPWQGALFWAVLLVVAELLPVGLGFETRVTMGFPIHIAIAIEFEPGIAMAIAAVGSFDSREFSRSIPLYRGIFNHAQVMLSIGVASFIVHSSSTPFNPLLVGLAAVAHFIINLGLVAGAVHMDRGVPFRTAFASIPPRPLAGTAITYLLLTALGAATAFAYREVGTSGEWVVIAILVPLLFARMAIQGAKTQQEMSEKIQRQQEALLAASETVFQERELERHRIAEHIHDSSLQMLAAAAYGASNTAALMESGKLDRAKQTLSAADEAIHMAMVALREALVDLRRSSVEEGGLMTTISKFVEQLSVLWGAQIRIEGGITNEPPIPVALAAFQILQEGVVNALKHSDSEEIVVRISEDQTRMVHIVVEDQGTGFDPEKQAEADHVGMSLMRERAEGVGGEIKLHTAPGQGTRLEAILPAGVSAA